MPITSNAGQLSGSIRAAGDVLREGLGGVETEMAGIMLAAVHAPRRTGAYAGSIRADAAPGRASIVSGSDYGNIIEFGSRWVSGRRVLLRAVESSAPAWLAAADRGVQTIVDQIEG